MITQSSRRGALLRPAAGTTNEIKLSLHALAAPGAGDARGRTS
jgi:hypothetical protein